MKRLRLPNLVCAAALVIVVGRAVIASDQSTQSPVQNGAEKLPIVLAQNALSKQKGAGRAKVNVDRKGVILKGYDAIAYVNEGKPVKGIPEIKSNYQDATYLFASAENKADFDKDPRKYAPQYGGFCAYGIALGVLADIEDSPKAFVVYNGKLYICGNEDVLKKFMAGIDGNIEKADKQWRRISKL
jgi:YHS domain-containing protein